MAMIVIYKEGTNEWGIEFINHNQFKRVSEVLQNTCVFIKHYVNMFILQSCI